MSDHNITAVLDDLTIATERGDRYRARALGLMSKSGIWRDSYRQSVRTAATERRDWLDTLDKRQDALAAEHERAERLTAERDSWQAAHAERSAKVGELQAESDALLARCDGMYAQAVRNAAEADASEARYAAALADGEQAQLAAEAAVALLGKAVLFVRYAKFDAGYQAADGHSYVQSRSDTLAAIDAFLAGRAVR